MENKLENKIYEAESKVPGCKKIMENVLGEKKELGNNSYWDKSLSLKDIVTYDEPSGQVCILGNWIYNYWRGGDTGLGKTRYLVGVISDPAQKELTTLCSEGFEVTSPYRHSALDRDRLGFNGLYPSKDSEGDLLVSYVNTSGETGGTFLIDHYGIYNYGW